LSIVKNRVGDLFSRQGHSFRTKSFRQAKVLRNLLIG
jgi:hypothetical protein